MLIRVLKTLNNAQQICVIEIIKSPGCSGGSFTALSCFTLLAEALLVFLVFLLDGQLV